MHGPELELIKPNTMKKYRNTLEVAYTVFFCNIPTIYFVKNNNILYVVVCVARGLVKKTIIVYLSLIISQRVPTRPIFRYFRIALVIFNNSD